MTKTPPSKRREVRVIRLYKVDTYSGSWFLHASDIATARELARKSPSLSGGRTVRRVNRQDRKWGYPFIS